MSLKPAPISAQVPPLVTTCGILPNMFRVRTKWDPFIPGLFLMTSGLSHYSIYFDRKNCAYMVVFSQRLSDLSFRVRSAYSAVPVSCWLFEITNYTSKGVLWSDYLIWVLYIWNRFFAIYPVAKTTIFRLGIICEPFQSSLETVPQNVCIMVNT